MKILAFTLVLIVIIYSPSAAYWPVNYFLNLPICTAANDQRYPRMLPDGSGGVFITWSDQRNGGDSDIYVQRVDTRGNILWTADGLPVCTVAAGQSDARIASDSSEGAIIAFRDFRDSKVRIFAQRIDANGDTLWGAGGSMLCAHSSTKYHPEIVADGSGGAIVTWQDHRTGNYDVYAQRVDANGDTLWPADGLPICTAANSQEDAQLVADGSGGAIITWEDERGIDYDIYAQRINASGDTIGPADGIPICNATGDQYRPQIIADGSGGAIITWQDSRGTDYDIYAQRINANGDTLWQANGIPICNADNDQSSPVMTGTSPNVVIITWRDDRDYGDIYAQRIDTNGDTLWSADGIPICTTVGSRDNPQITADGSGGAVIAWSESPGSYINIYAQRVDSSGAILWSIDGVPVSEASGYQYRHRLTGDGDGGAIAAWFDTRSAHDNIYAQRVNWNGTLGPVPAIASIADVPEDQGRQVAILWDRSHLDTDPAGEITYYSVWRRNPGGLRSKNGDWTLIDSVEAHQFEGYAYLAPTLEDSSSGGAAYTTFHITAHIADTSSFWDSAPDSGYSVDDITPAQTKVNLAPVGGARAAIGSVRLSWDPVTTGENGSPEPDPLQYRVYCGTEAFFGATPENLLSATWDLHLTHTDERIGDPGTNLFYLITSIDGSGNESAVSNRVGEFDRLCRHAKKK